MKTLRAAPGIVVWLVILFARPLFADNDAETVIRRATTEIYQAIESECEQVRLDPGHLYTLVDRILIPHADFARMSRWVLAKFWRDADEKQREVFVEQFRGLLIRTYATAIQLAKLDDIDYLPQRPSARQGRATVRTEIKRPGEPLVTLQYELYQLRGTWLVYDILVDGVSLVSNYRTSFAEEIRARGIEALLDSLRQKNNEAMTESTAAFIRSRLPASCAGDRRP